VILIGSGLAGVLWTATLLRRLLTTGDCRRLALFPGLRSTLILLLRDLGLFLLLLGFGLSLSFPLTLSLCVRGQGKDGYRQNDRLNPASFRHC
jgi:hypothetical protein